MEKLTQVIGLRLPGDEDSRGNRVHGLGALMGLATGVAIGAVLGALDGASHGAFRRLPPGAAVAAVGAGALVAANGPMAAAGVTDPRTWTPSAWVSDLVPHAGYGAVTALTYLALGD